MRVVVNTAHLDKLGKGLGVETVLRKLAMDTESSIKNNFSSQSPSPVGSPPGVDTGNLKNSVVAVRRGKGWAVIIGADYGADLEYGTRKMPARPFVRPAVRRVVNAMNRRDLVDIVEDV